MLGLPSAGMRRRVEAALGGPLDNPPTFHLVRDVAPNKKMYCISFRVPASIAFAGAGAAAAAQEHTAAEQEPGQEGVGDAVAAANSKRQKVA
jgi:hypothetical protein